MKKIFFSVFVGLVAIQSSAHNYFVSTASMEYDEITQAIEVSVKMTAHDFEHILENKFQQRLHIENIADSTEIGLFIQNYLKENFIIVSEGQATEFKYHGKEVTLRDELFFYVSFANVKNPNTIHVTNTLLFTHFAQQQNKVNYTRGEKTKSVTLVAAKPDAELKLE